MTLVREPGSNVIAQFTVPYKGTWKNLPANTVPTEAVHDSMNVFVREGKLRNRPGLLANDDFIFTEPILGGFQIVTPSQKTILAISRSKVYQLNGTANTWSTLSPVMLPFAPDDNSIIDMTFMETSGEYVALIAQENYKLRKWTLAPNTVVELTGTNIPTASSICTAASRIIALIQPHTVVWSNVINPAVFDSNAIVRRAQTGDHGICVKSLSALSFVLYKERSIHLVRAQAGLTESTAFSFSEPLLVEGPAGIYAVVSFNGVHIYMTKNGRIAMFDGTGYPTWIADGIWLFLQNDISQPHAHKIRGVYDYRLHTVTFFYPQVNNADGLRGMVIINLPLEGLDVAQPQQPYSFLGVCEKPVVHCCEKRFGGIVDRSLLFTKQSSTINDAQSFTFDENVNFDGDMPFNCSFQTGLQSMPDARHSFVTVEPFFERAVNYGSVLMEPVISDTLETPSGIIPDTSGQYISLENNPVREYIGFGKPVRFFGVRYSWASTNTVRYNGTVIYSGALKV